MSSPYELLALRDLSTLPAAGPERVPFDATKMTALTSPVDALKAGRVYAYRVSPAEAVLLVFRRADTVGKGGSYFPAYFFTFIGETGATREIVCRQESFNSDLWRNFYSHSEEGLTGYEIAGGGVIFRQRIEWPRAAAAARFTSAPPAAAAAAREPYPATVIFRRNDITNYPLGLRMALETIVPGILSNTIAPEVLLSIQACNEGLDYGPKPPLTGINLLTWSELQCAANYAMRAGDRSASIYGALQLAKSCALAASATGGRHGKRRATSRPRKTKSRKSSRSRKSQKKRRESRR